MRAIGGAPVLNWLNTTAERHGGGGGHMTPGGGGTSGWAGSGQPQPVHVYLDGREIFASVKQQGAVYGTRNSGSRTGLLIPGQKVGSGIG